MKAVLDTKVQSAYDDDIAERYHFPSRYLETLTSCIGDWVVFRQPRASGGTLSYFATARVREIVQDPSNSTHYYALIDKFSSFDEPVPWRTDGAYAERAIRQLPNIAQVGLYLRGRSVRPLDEDDYFAIVEIGFRASWDPSNLAAGAIDEATANLLAARLEASARRKGRLTIACLTNKAVRDRAFRKAVCAAYGHRCAISKLSIVDASGLSEVQAAHIVPVADGGLDTVPNGIALSATVHWLFDRHLISINENMQLMIAPSVSGNEWTRILGTAGAQIFIPTNKMHHPLDIYLARHRGKFNSVNRV
jgi:putative restriction endonuclease